MNKKQLLVTAAIAGLTLSLSACPANESAQAATGECHGINSCKGTGECSGEGHDCGGKNECKGHGWVKTTADECGEKGGDFKS